MKVSEEVDLIEGTRANVYVFRVGGSVVQVDAGFDKSAQQIVTYYENSGLVPSMIILTHSHVDHIRGLGTIYTIYRPLVYAHREEIPVITGHGKQYFKNPFMRVLLPFIRVPTVPLVNDVFGLALDGVKIVETPGHTPGSITVLLNTGHGRFAFVGDAAFEREGRLYVNERYSIDAQKSHESLEKIKQMSPVIVLPGHGKPVKLRGAVIGPLFA
ncbi:MAG: MBL fold metallo-hydrolase [Thermoprotei archaeon]